MTPTHKKPVCGKPMPKAKNGNDRGFCTKTKGHNSRWGPLPRLGSMHGSNTCYGCGVKLTLKTASSFITKRGSGVCRACWRQHLHVRRGVKPKNTQTPNTYHTFPCGCSGLLPERGQSNQLASWSSDSWICRVSNILNGSNWEAKKRNYKTIDPSTPHAVIRTLMRKPDCDRCKQPLEWICKHGKTPHLHHNHDTGEIYGFTHPKCNPRALEIENEKLKQEIKRLQQLHSVPSTNKDSGAPQYIN